MRTHDESVTGAPLKVLIAADTYPPNINGAARFAHRLALGLADRGHEVHVVAPHYEKGGHATEEQEGGIVVHRVKSRTSITYEGFRICAPWDIAREVGRVLDEVGPDVVHLQCHFGVGRTVAKAARARGIHLVGTNHFMPENFLHYLPVADRMRQGVSAVAWRDMGRVFRLCDVVTAPTPRAAKLLEEQAKVPGVLPVSCGIDSSEFELEAGEKAPKSDHPVILFVGRLAEEKHVDVLLSAVAHLPKSLDAHVEIVGGGEHRAALERQAAALGIAHRVRFLGQVSDEKLRRAYQRCTVFCMPGTAELQSLVTLEAMSASKPVVLADAMALPHLVREGENGHLFAPGDHLDLAEKLRLVLEADPARRAAMGEVSHEMVAGHAIQATLDTFEGLYVPA